MLQGTEEREMISPMSQSNWHRKGSNVQIYQGSKYCFKNRTITIFSDPQSIPDHEDYQLGPSVH